MTAKKVSIFSNNTPTSEKVSKLVRTKLTGSGFIVTDNLCSDTSLLVTIGGDGSTLDALHKYNFPEIPILGINTGHLGFFQEIDTSTIDDFIFSYNQGRYCLQPLNAVEAVVEIPDQPDTLIKALNEIVIRGTQFYAAHLNISIEGSFIERYSGDGILVASAAGSTAYNYSMGGAIVDPRINHLQVTPIAPMNTTAYRSFTSSILLPSDLKLQVTPEYIKNDLIRVISDGKEATFENVKKITVCVSDSVVNLVRFENYDFWNKVKTKFL